MRNGSPGRLEILRRYWDPALYLPGAHMPMLFISSEADAHFPLTALQDSAGLPEGTVRVSYSPSMRHGHSHGWRPEIIYAFADSIVRDAPRLPELAEPRTQNDRLICRVEGGAPVASARLHWTADAVPGDKSTWTTAPAASEGRSVSAPIPGDARCAFFIVTDRHGRTVSSRCTRCSTPAERAAVHR